MDRICWYQLPHTLSCNEPKLTPTRSLFPSSLKGTRDGGNRRCVRNKSGFTVHTQLCIAPDIGDHGWSAATHCFDQGKRQSLVTRGEHQQMVLLPNRFNVGDMTMKTHIVKVQ
jgi:hypothetical protein